MRRGEHPEDLIDRAQRGGLDRGEQAALQQHVDACAACALQLSLAARFERELAPQPRDAAVSERAVAGAIERLQHLPRIGRARPRWSRWAAAALLLFGVTAAAAVIGRRLAPRPAPPPPPAVESPARAAPARTVVPPPAEAPVAPEAPPAKPVPSAHAAAVHPAITAEALFEHAEQLRRQGSTDAAIAVYRRLQAAFPATAEAQLSFALAGQLLLARGRPADALAQFDRHLGAPHMGDGQVAEEALAGRATALEQLRRIPEAIAAWKSLLARYPRSVYAERARARLGELTEKR